jgi:hypothetical protein
MRHCECQLSHEVAPDTLIDPGEELAESPSIGRGVPSVLAHSLSKPVKFIQVARRLGTKSRLHFWALT